MHSCRSFEMPQDVVTIGCMRAKGCTFAATEGNEVQDAVVGVIRYTRSFCTSFDTLTNQDSPRNSSILHGGCDRRAHERCTDKVGAICLEN